MRATERLVSYNFRRLARPDEPTLQLLLRKCLLILVKIKELLGDGVRSRLILRVMVGLEIRVLQSLLDGNTLHGIEGQQLLEQVESQIGSFGEHGLHGDLLLERERANVFSGAAGLDAVVVFHSGCAKNVEDEGELVVV